MTAVVDGPALRSLRESQNVPMRRIARVADMSHGHLSKLERGEHGRPVTPMVLFAYQKVLGIDIPQVIAAGVLPPRQAARAARVTKGGQWRLGVLAPVPVLASGQAGCDIAEAGSSATHSASRPACCPAAVSGQHWSTGTRNALASLGRRSSTSAAVTRAPRAD